MIQKSQIQIDDVFCVKSETTNIKVELASPFEGRRLFYNISVLPQYSAHEDTFKAKVSVTAHFLTERITSNGQLVLDEKVESNGTFEIETDYSTPLKGLVIEIVATSEEVSPTDYDGKTTIVKINDIII